jgi:hypothetical protein
MSCLTESPGSEDREEVLTVQLRIVFDGSPDHRIEAELVALKTAKQDISISRWSMLAPSACGIPSPSAHFIGAISAWDFGSEAVLKLLADIREGRIY